MAAVTETRLNLAYTRVEAPISGITSRALQSEGTLVQAQQTLLTKISQIDPVRRCSGRAGGPPRGHTGTIEMCATNLR